MTCLAFRIPFAKKATANRAGGDGLRGGRAWVLKADTEDMQVIKDAIDARKMI
ncbi:hypothetical protein HGO38_21735 [Rhizobium sp. CG5]|uniref:hypothetical protein n=1 Tax=Rhizobium sp. CG5 TaxID=2726076 RepID=UPI002033EBBD|nr:hypothetical protein [Rhizobium sp. CG5]MCM2476102.1 hypothetical protein [Rhizobium sp. CG5]